MAVKTGYETSETKALRDRIEAGRVALRAHLPRTLMGDILLVCGCSMCIDDDVYHTLRRTLMAELTPQQVGQYFGGAGVLDADTGPEARQEAFSIFLHVMDALAVAMLQSREVERAYKRVWSFVEPEYWHEPLYATGFIADLTPEQSATLRDLLIDLVALGSAKNLPRMTDALIFLSRATDAFGQVLDGFVKGPPRRQLGFWIAVAGWAPNSPAGKRHAGVTDFKNNFDFMAKEDRLLLEDTLAAPETGTLLERYAYAAQDEEWLGYLSRLIAWRENTVLRNAANRG